MMMCDTELRPSPIHGIGVFLLEPVKAGQLLWRFDSRIDRIYSEAEVASLPVRMQRKAPGELIFETRPPRDGEQAVEVDTEEQEQNERRARD